MLLGLISDTHGVFDPAAAAALKGTAMLLHAGDVGHHGSHTEVLKAYTKATGTPLLAVAGNVDDTQDAKQVLPAHRILEVCGWKLLVTHIVAPGPNNKVDAAAADLITQHHPDLVVCGHSHKAAHWTTGGIHFINPGSAGPARFKLKRTVATLWLPHRTGPSTALKLAVSQGCSPAALPAFNTLQLEHSSAGGSAGARCTADAGCTAGGDEPTQGPHCSSDDVKTSGGSCTAAAAVAVHALHMGASRADSSDGLQTDPPAHCQDENFVGGRLVVSRQQQQMGEAVDESPGCPAWLCFHELPQRAPRRLAKQR